MTAEERLLITKIEAALNKRATAQRLLEEAEEEIKAASYALRRLGENDARIDTRAEDL